MTETQHGRNANLKEFKNGAWMFISSSKQLAVSNYITCRVTNYTLIMEILVTHKLF